MTEVLTRETAIPNKTTPTGRVIGCVPLEHNPAMLTIRFVDGKGGEVPEPLQGLWTGLRQADEAIKDYLTKFWNTSDEASKPLSKKAAA